MPDAKQDEKILTKDDLNPYVQQLANEIKTWELPLWQVREVLRLTKDKLEWITVK